MSIMKFFTDEHIPKATVQGIRRKGYIVIRSEDVGMKSATDEELLIYATDHDYTLLSMDDDVTRLYKEWRMNERDHMGIVYAPMAKYKGEAGIGPVVRWCVEFAELIEAGAGTLEGDVKNKLFQL